MYKLSTTVVVVFVVVVVLVVVVTWRHLCAGDRLLDVESGHSAMYCGVPNDHSNHCCSCCCSCCNSSNSCSSNPALIVSK